MKLGFVSNSLAQLPLDALLARHKPFHTIRFGEFGHATRDGLSRAGLAQSKEEETMKSMKGMRGVALTSGVILACTAWCVASPASAQNKQMTVAMITHAQPGDTFWDIIRKGAEAAAKKDNIRLIYLADPTATKEAQLISNVVQQHVDGIALTLAFPDAEAPAVASGRSRAFSAMPDRTRPWPARPWAKD